MSRAAMVASLLLLAACHGANQAPSDAPSGFAVTPGDGQVVVSWNQQSGLDYWIFYKAGASVSSTDSGTSIIYKAQSPRVISTVVTKGVGLASLANGTQYAFVMNATNGDSKAGPSTSVITATPRLAGASWTSGSPLGTQNLNAVAYGAVPVAGVSTNTIVAVGNAGTIFYGPYNYASTIPPGVTAWTQAGVPSGYASNLNAVVATGSSFAALGADGSVLTSADSVTWTTATSIVPAAGTTMNGIARGSVSGVVLYVSVGTSGQIFTSTDLSTWSPATSGTANDLYGIAFVNGIFIATGANGTLLTSADGITWTAQISNTANILRGAAYGTGTAGAYYVVVGDAGTIRISADGTNWSTITPFLANNLRSITFGSRFVAVGQGGAAIYSDDASNWSLTSASASDLNGVVWTPAMYVAVGALGANAVAK